MTDPVAWAADAFAALNLTWKDAPAKFPRARALGVTADKAALMDVTTRRGKLIAASAVTPVKAEYTPLLTFLLAALVERATLPEADQFLARQLGRLRRDRPSQISAPWHQWRVTLTTTALGLLTMQVQ